MKTLVLFLLLSASVLAQYNDPVASRMSTVIIEADQFIGQDSYDYQYFIKNNTLFKIKGTETFQYKNPSLGKISSVDIQNPLRIILFYENFNVVVALDNQLNEVQKINFLEKLGGMIVSVCGFSSQNNFWIFDSTNQQLRLFNYRKNSHKPIGQPFDKAIKKYTADFNDFYWIDVDNKFYRYDIFGKKKLLAQIPNFDQVFICDERLVLYKKDDILYFFDIEENKSIPINDIEKSFKSFYYKNQNLAIFTDEGITNYIINLP